MRKLMFVLLIPALMFTSCATSNGGGVNPGAMVAGASIGGNLGSAIGGIVGSNSNRWNGGWRGSAIGSIVGTVAGAAIGGAVSAAASQQRQAAVQQSSQSNVYSAPARGQMANPLDGLQIENIRFIDDSRSQIINPNETCKIIFDIYNTGNSTAYNIIPEVQNLSETRGITISPSVMIEAISPGEGFRYTATLYASNKLKTGTLTIKLLLVDDSGYVGDWQEFTLQTQKN